MTIKHLGLLCYSRHFATINNLFYLNPLQRIGYVFVPYVAFYVTGIHTFYTAIIIIIIIIILFRQGSITELKAAFQDGLAFKNCITYNVN